MKEKPKETRARLLMTSLLFLSLSYFMVTNHWLKILTNQNIYIKHSFNINIIFLKKKNRNKRIHFFYIICLFLLFLYHYSQLRMPDISYKCECLTLAQKVKSKFHVWS
jgi:hypothetical protein